MDREDIIRMAREACDQAPREDWNSNAWVFGDETLERFATLVAVAEREACAKVCDGMDHNGVMIAADCAAAIRARGQQ
jgi:putative NIF3 family GTP cyclohydrolase 1 type 2